MLKGDYPVDFKDVNAKFWAYSYIDKLAANEVTNGYMDLTFKPNHYVTRAQMAACIYRALTGSPFNPEKYKDHLSFETFQVKNGAFYFDNMNPKLPGSKINPYIQRQIYSVVQALIDTRYYTKVSYNSSNAAESRVAIQFGRNPAFIAKANYNFSFLMWDQAYQKPHYSNHSDKIVISLFINRLWDDYHNRIKGEYAETYIKDKLKNSLEALFGQGTGEKVFAYVYPLYHSHQEFWMNYNSRETFMKNLGTKKIDNLQVNVEAFQSEIIVTFSYR
ncbi:S-layer homology domain-containing protein [Anoxybacteroides rupiense]|uniref:S-layer homology domain-containing protein n=1 Tax=Anoxybacteroides rupiense TaxID=311460 RepID=UPI001606222D|nr:S-layer homology domain-containing protein [Anoxybacillus rupiensis]MBB3905726.1 hypothetical protein [Anoxybacillus rupiensis]